MKKEPAGVEERCLGPTSPTGGSLVTVAYPRPADFLARVPFECEIDPKFTCMDELLADTKIELAVTNDLARSAPGAWWNGRPATPAGFASKLGRARITERGGYSLLFP